MKYQIEYQETNHGFFDVEADNENEAIDKFWEMVGTGEIDLLNTDIADSDAWVDAVHWPDEILYMELEDDASEIGGTAFAGETVMDFLESFDERTFLSLDALNEGLKRCGIKPVSIDGRGNAS